MIIRMNDDHTPHSLPGPCDDDPRIAFWLRECLPQEVDTDRIKLSTFLKIERKRRGARRRRAAVAFALCAACVCLAIFLPRGKAVETVSGGPTTVSRPATAYRVAAAPTARVRRVVLADGTAVVLNSRSRLRYPERFGNTRREVTLQGEAYFEVAHKAHCPFVVHTSRFDIEVLGTKFNVNSYDSRSASVALVDGAVQVMAGKGRERVLMRPGNLLRVSDGNISELVRVNATDYLAWMERKMKLNGDHVGQVLTALANYYGLRVTPEVAALGMSLYGRIELKDRPDEVIKAVARLAGTGLVIKDNTIHSTY